MRKFLTSLFLIMAAVVSQGTATITYSSITNVPAGLVLANGAETHVSATITPSIADPATITNATLFFRDVAYGWSNQWYSVTMGTAGGNVYTGTVPRMAQGSAYYYISCYFTGSGAVSPSNSTTRTYSISTTIDKSRVNDFEGAWTWSGTNYSNSLGWSGDGVFVTLWANTRNKLSGNSSKYCGWLRNQNGAYWKSPQVSDLGTISFECMLRNIATGWTADISVQYASDTLGPWTTLTNITLVTTNTTRVSVPANIASPVYVRFLRTSSDVADLGQSTAIILDNISLSPRAANLSILETYRSPQHVTSNDYVVVRIRTDSTDTNVVPALNHVAYLNYRVNGSSFSSVPMSYTETGQYGNAFLGVIPAQPAGSVVEYYYSATFDGYYYNNPYTGFTTENNNPKTLPTSGYYTYTVNNYHTDYDSMYFVGLNWGWTNMFQTNITSVITNLEITTFLTADPPSTYDGYQGYLATSNAWLILNTPSNASYLNGYYYYTNLQTTFQLSTINYRITNDVMTYVSGNPATVALTGYRIQNNSNLTTFATSYGITFSIINGIPTPITNSLSLGVSFPVNMRPDRTQWRASLDPANSYGGYMLPYTNAPSYNVAADIKLGTNWVSVYTTTNYTITTNTVAIYIGTPTNTLYTSTNMMSLIADDTWDIVAPDMSFIIGTTNSGTGFSYWGISKTYLNGMLTTSNTYFGEDDQDLFSFPFSGIASTGGTVSNSYIRVPVAYSGYVISSLNASNGAYALKRAAYQTFNTWQADPLYFEARTFSDARLYWEDFESWNTNYYSPPVLRIDPLQVGRFNDDGVFMSSSTNPFPTCLSYDPSTNMWVGRNFDSYLTERQFSGSQYATNKAICLDGTINALVYNIFSPENGIDMLSVSARQRVDRGLGTYLNPLGSYNYPYRVVTSFRAREMSPDLDAGISLRLCYSYTNLIYSGYEILFSQADDLSGQDGLIQASLYYVTKSYPFTTDTLSLVVGPFDAAVGGLKLTDASPVTVDVSWTYDLTSVSFSGTVQRLSNGSPDVYDSSVSPPVRISSGLPQTNMTIFTIDPTVWKDTSATRLTGGGSPGFVNKDTVPEIQVFNLYNGVDSPQTNVVYDSTNTNTAFGASFYMGGAAYSGEPVWNDDGYLVRLLTASYVDCGMGESGGSPSYGFYNGDDLYYYTNITASIEVTSLVYQAFAFNLPTVWYPVGVRMTQNTYQDNFVVLDDFRIDPWRASTRNQWGSNTTDNVASSGGVPYWNWSASSQQYAWEATEVAGSNGFLVEEGWIVDAVTNRYLELDGSRHNNSLIQSFVTPSKSLWSLLSGGGVLAFDTMVLSGTNVFRADMTLDGITWLPYSSQITQTVTGVSNRMIIPLLAAAAVVKSRIFLLPPSFGTSSDAIMYIDNVAYWDYPAPYASPWSVYNALISSPWSSNSTLDKAYEPLNITNQTCYLNSNQTANVNGTLAAYKPYLMSPAMSGIGEVRFLYRSWSTNSANITISGSSGQSDFNWMSFTNFSATNTSYAQFQTVINNETQNVLWISSDTQNTERACIDNVLVSEAANPQFAIKSVTLYPEQPLTSDVVTASATIMPYFDPSSIRVYFSYYVGTNLWGVANWRGYGLEPSNACTTIEMMNTSGYTWATPVGTGIPIQNAYTVVQYVVWGTTSNGPTKLNIENTNAFSTASWYYPVDLTNQYKTIGWSPYYWVYDIQTNEVYVNEVNYAVTTAERTNEYLEVAVPAGSDLLDWRIQLVNSVGTLYTNMTIPSKVYDNRHNGWGFFVWGDATVSNVDVVFSPPLNNNIQTPGGSRLIRPNGSYEDRVCWGAALSGYRYAGVKNPFSGGTLSLTGTGSNKYDFAWSVVSTFTPGTNNTGQTFTPPW